MWLYLNVSKEIFFGTLTYSAPLRYLQPHLRGMNSIFCGLSLITLNHADFSLGTSQAGKLRLIIIFQLRCQCISGPGIVFSVVEMKKCNRNLVRNLLSNIRQHTAKYSFSEKQLSVDFSSNCLLRKYHYLK